MWGVITNTSIQSYTPDRTANSLITESPWLWDTEMLLFCYRTCRPSQMGLSACFYSPVVDGSCKVSLSPCYTVCLGLPEIGKKTPQLPANFYFFDEVFWSWTGFIYLLHCEAPNLFFEMAEFRVESSPCETLDTLSHHCVTTLSSSGTQAEPRVLKWRIPQIHVPFLPLTKKPWGGDS